MILDHNNLPEKYFEKICSIPHPSYHEKEISDYVVSEAKRLGYEYIQDDIYNVIVKVPATPGYEDKPAIMLQGHMDMVPTKIKGYEFNFETDPLQLYMDGRILRAKNTTLGADDGVAVAYMLSVMNDHFDHPLIECVFTVQEEVGCNGASHVDTSYLVSRRLVGLDSAGEHDVVVGNYCSDLVEMTKSFNYMQTSKEAYKVSLKEIDAFYVGDHLYDYTKNAIQYLAHIIKELDATLVSIDGGKAENFPPQNCSAVIITDQSLDGIDMIDYEKVTVDHCLSKEDSEAILNMILNIPNGATQYSDTLLSSFMLGKITTTDKSITMIGSTRSQNDEYNQTPLDQLNALCEKYGFTLAKSVRYRSWKYIENSKLREDYRVLCKKYLGKDIIEGICPGGLEISDFIYKMGEIDVLAIGPLTGGFHTPDEWLDIDSFNRMYKILKELIVM